MSRKLRNGLIGTAAGLGVAALLVPVVAGGNARPPFEPEVPLLAQLTGGAEAPGPGDADGSGAAAVTIDSTNDEVCFDISWTGIASATLAHIHVGPPGTPGPVVVDFTPHIDALAELASGCVIDTDADAISTNPANYYVNVHNADFPGGAVRGQLADGPFPANSHVLSEPLRAYDSRNTTDGKLAPGQTRTIGLQSGLGASGAETLAVPPGASAAVVTLTITETEGAGFVKLYSADVPEPPTSNINWSQAGQNLAVSTTVSVNAHGEVDITGGFGSTHVVVDVTAFLF
jgi:hypothetical protein